MIPIRRGTLGLKKEGRVTDGKLGSSQLIESPSARSGASAQCLAVCSWVPDAAKAL